MYKILGADGKEYGPVNLDQMRKWIAEGRVNAQTRVQESSSAEWKNAADYLELGLAPAASSDIPGSPASITPTGQPAKQQNGLAITSLVLGVLGMICFGPVTGIPAIICGHMARSRARRAPAQFGGAGLALAGLILGYVSNVFIVAILAALLLPALSNAKGKAETISCINNMKMIGLSFRTWAIDNEDNFPFNVSTNKGGTLELCSLGTDGFDRNAVFHFRVMSNELSTPKILLCPADKGKQPAIDFPSLLAANISYQLHSGTNFSDANPDQILAICPIHNNVLHCDGSVMRSPKGAK